MTKSPINITLAGKDYAIKPTTIGQLGKIEAILMTGDRSRPIAMAMSVLGVALSRDHGDVAVGDLEGTVAEIDAASKAVLRLAGYVDDEPAPTDDAPAGGSLVAVGSGAHDTAAA